MPDVSRSAVAFVDLTRIEEHVTERILVQLGDILRDGSFIDGLPVREFESAFARYVGVDHCVALSSGTAALRLGLTSAGIGPGDEVIVPAHTFIATFEAVAQAGATPVPVEISEADYCMDAPALAAAVGPRTRAVIPVHLYGQMADMCRIAPLAHRLGLWLFEDAAQCHGAAREGLRAGACGRAAAFSFYPSKNLGAMGDAGAFVTGDEDLASRVRALRQHGETARYNHHTVGSTERMDTIQAVCLLEKLPLLDGWNDSRRASARRYSERLAGVGDIRLPPVAEGSEPVWHLYVIRTAHATELQGFLRSRGVATGRHYPTPPHLSPAFTHLGHPPGSFPVAEALAREGLSLPMFPQITPEEIDTVASAVAEFFDG